MAGTRRGKHHPLVLRMRIDHKARTRGIRIKANGGLDAARSKVRQEWPDVGLVHLCFIGIRDDAIDAVRIDYPLASSFATLRPAPSSPTRGKPYKIDLRSTSQMKTGQSFEKRSGFVWISNQCKNCRVTLKYCLSLFGRKPGIHAPTANRSFSAS